MMSLMRSVRQSSRPMDLRRSWYNSRNEMPRDCLTSPGLGTTNNLGVFAMRPKRTTPYDPPVERTCLECGSGFSAPAAWVRKGGAKYCGAPCYRAASTRKPDAVLALPFVRNEDGCRLLLDATGRIRADYVDMMIAGKRTAAHRVAWEIANGRTQPSGLVVRHLCAGGGNPACIEPAHLALGTTADNAQDAVRAGRSATGERNGAYTRPERKPWGESHPRVKLTAAQALEIRQTYVPRHPIYGGAALARKFGVGETTVLHIIHGENWRRLK